MIGPGALSQRIRVLVVGASLAFLPALCQAQQAYLIGTVAGGGLPDSGVPAVSQSVGNPFSVAVDASGSVYFGSLNCVFKVDTAGVLTRVAGVSPLPGYSGDGGPATSARLNYPSGIAVDGAGNVYIADARNYRVRKVAAATGFITTVAGNGIQGYAGDGGTATSAQFDYPGGVAVDGSGNLYIADVYRIRKVAAAAGIITTIAGNGAQGYAGDGGPAAGAQFGGVAGVALDSSANLYIADAGNNRVRKVAAATGTITTAAGNGAEGYSGDGGPATSAELDSPYGVAVDGSGNLFIGDFYNYSIRKVATGTGVITTVAGNGTEGISGNGGLATDAQLGPPFGVAVDASGNLFIADLSSQIRGVPEATGIITAVAGSGVSSYSGDGGLATSAQLDHPWNVAVDGQGNLYIADTFNNRIRKVAAGTGIITTAAGGGTAGLGDGGPATSAQISLPTGVAVDGSGNLFITDSGNNLVRKVAAATGIITTVAGNGYQGSSGDGGLATSAELDDPRSVAVDGSGNLFIADFFNHKIRKVAAGTGIITTFAGNGTPDYSGDGGPATAAEISVPYAIAVDGSGNLFIADFNNNSIRKVTAATGIITTVAGNGDSGYSGDGGLATNAELEGPWSVAVDGSGNLYIGDQGHLRKVSAETGIITTLFGSVTTGITLSGSGQVFFTESGYNVVWLINDSGAAASEITASNVASLDHLTFNFPIENSGGSTQSAASPGSKSSASAIRTQRGDKARPKAALSASGVVTVGGTMQITEILVRDPSAPAANNVAVGATLPPTWTITSCLAGSVPCPATGSNTTVTYPVLATGQSPTITLIADGPAGSAAQLDLSSTSDSETLATAFISQILAASPGATLTPSFQGPSGIAAGQGIQYTVALANSGGAALAQDPITVAVSMDPSLVSPSVQADASMWTCTPAGATFTCTNTSGLAAGGEIGFTVNAVVPPAAGGRNLSSSATLTFGGQVVTQNVGSTVTGGQSIAPFFSGEVYAGSGVYDLQFPDGNPFGYFHYVATSILYHYEMGYEAFIPGSSADVYLYDFTSSHWLYASSALFPYLYDFTLNTWLYYFPNTTDPGHYTTNPRYFSNLTTGKIFTM